MGIGYIVEDDRVLSIQVNAPLVQSAIPDFPLTEMVEVDLERAMEREYWTGLAIKKDDLIVLDLNLQRAIVGGMKVAGRTITGGHAPSYTGFDVLKMLQESKKRGELPGLERVLVATSIERAVKPQSINPDLALAEGFDVYGMAKGVDAFGRIDTQGYVLSLLTKIAQIYNGEATLLNEGWRS